MKRNKEFWTHIVCQELEIEDPLFRLSRKNTKTEEEIYWARFFDISSIFVDCYILIKSAKSLVKWLNILDLNSQINSSKSSGDLLILMHNVLSKKFSKRQEILLQKMSISYYLMVKTLSFWEINIYNTKVDYIVFAE